MKSSERLYSTGLAWIWLSFFVITLDWMIKWVAATYLSLGKSVTVLSFFNLTLSHNRGAAFSFLNQQNGWQFWLFSGIAAVVSVIVFASLYRLPCHKKWLCVSLALILGGALGNLGDRLLHGYVIDFLDFYVNDWHWPAFNIADSAICAGACMLIVDIFRKPKVTC